MSMMLMVKAMRIKVGNPLRKLVLIKLADNASDSGECWPSHQHIADQCEISRRSVINHINKLEEMGFLRKEYRTKNNEKQSNLYHLTLDNPSLDDLGSAGDSLPSAGDAQGGAGDSLGGSAGDAHRTSHSPEPINEPSSYDREELLQRWNEVAPVKMRKIVAGGPIDKSIKARIADYGIDGLYEAIDRIPKSSFLSGKVVNQKTGKLWKMTFSWFIGPQNFEKVYNGNYPEDEEQVPVSEFGNGGYGEIVAPKFDFGKGDSHGN